jgi:hypothetical protein
MAATEAAKQGKILRWVETGCATRRGARREIVSGEDATLVGVGMDEVAGVEARRGARLEAGVELRICF